jgi:hypothetical protein
MVEQKMTLPVWRAEPSATDLLKVDLRIGYQKTVEALTPLVSGAPCGQL